MPLSGVDFNLLRIKMIVNVMEKMTGKKDRLLEGMLFRNDRFYSVDGKWFFSVRREADQGPYDSKDDAEQALKGFIAAQQLEQKQRKAEHEVIGIARRQNVYSIN